jgi:predicted transcriptional regulator
MDRKDLRDLELALGIQTPWFIKFARFNENDKCYDVVLDTGDKKLLTTFFSSTKKVVDSDLTTGRWRYMNVGIYPVYIHANVPNTTSAENGHISREVISRMAFLGDSGRNYSNYLRQQVALSQAKGIDSQSIANFLGLSDNVVQFISEDLSRSDVKIQRLALIPTEVDKIWEQLIRNHLSFRTQVLPLKFLLSRLSLAAAKTNDATKLYNLTLELRKFFIENHKQLEVEIEQICGVNTDHLRKQVRQNAAKQKLVLPSVRSPVWIDLLTGKLNLNSGSVPLNLLVSRQRNVFVQGNTDHDKLQAIETIRQYFKKNYRSLIQELTLLNRSMKSATKSELSLPEVDHKVWQKIIENENFIPSEHMAYRLLLAKLRAQVMTKPDPVIKLQAARRIRDFLGQNRKSMRQEVGVLMKQLAVV